MALSPSLTTRACTVETSDVPSLGNEVTIQPFVGESRSKFAVRFVLTAVRRARVQNFQRDALRES